MKLVSAPFLLGLAAAALTVLLIWKYLGAPVVIVDAPAGKVHCVSYTPYRGSETPFNPDYKADPVRIDEDLALLSNVADCVRTYSVDQRLDQVVPIAEKHGLQVLLGIWIGRNDATNRMQIAQAVKLANAHKKTIKAIIVGNEVLLRGEQLPDDLVGYLKEVKAATGLPVTYADVTDFWVKAPPELAQAVDFVTIHILPYWENDPTSAEEGVNYLRRVLEEVGPMFPGKDIFIGETGFPSAGRERAEAVPSIISQARYLRDLAAYAQATGLDYNLIEAFDQPWKRALEGTAGGHWGVFTTDRQPKFPWTGPVSNHPRWQLEGYASFVLAFLILFVVARAGGQPDSLGGLAAGIGAGVAGSMLLLQAEHSWIVWRSGLEAIAELVLFAQSLGIVIFVLPELVRGRRCLAPMPVGQTLAWLRSPNRATLGMPLYLGLVHLLAVFSALVVSLGLSFDARYRDFPLTAFGLASISLGLLALNRGDHKRRPEDRPEEALLAALFIATGCTIAFNEGPQNVNAMVWVLLNFLFALPWLGILVGAVRNTFFKRAATAEA